MTRIFFSAGETSGDLHGANLIKALRELEPAIECEGLGGKRMADAGMSLRCDLAEKGIMGFSEVVKSLAFIRRLMSDTVERLREFRPDCLVVIDYPGFNMRLAKTAKNMGIPVVYYISPQIWAWKTKRIHTIASIAKKVLVILPFEEKLYKDIGVDCTYVGHPLLDHLDSLEPSDRFKDEFAVALLPGSREQEIRKLLPPMLDVAKGIRDKYPGAKLAIPCVDKMRQTQVESLARDFPLETTVGPIYDIVGNAKLALVASGTATLETALLGVPLIVLYKTSALTYWIARYLIKIKHISLVNILAEKEIVPEFIQNDASADKILPVALQLLGDEEVQAKMKKSLGDVRQILGSYGASKRAAVEILDAAGASANG